MSEYEYDINSDNPVEDRMEYTHRQAVACRRRMREINPDDYDLSFLRKKVENEK
jgi:hypothetical protein